MPIVIAGLVAANAFTLFRLALPPERAPQAVVVSDGRAEAVALLDGRGGSCVLVGASADAYFADSTLCPWLLEQGVTRVDLLVETAGADVRAREALSSRLDVVAVARRRRFAKARGEEATAKPPGGHPGVTEIDPGDRLAVGEVIGVTFHATPSPDFLDPSQRFYRGLVADVRFGGARIVAALDASPECLAVCGRRVAAGPTVLVVSHETGGAAERLKAALQPGAILETGPDSAVSTVKIALLSR